MILFKPILINDLYIIVYHSRHKLTKEELKTKDVLTERSCSLAMRNEDERAAIESLRQTR